jgi:MIP family channel proteins
MRQFRPLTAEFFGTFALVFAGTSVIVASSFPGGNGGLVANALAHGLTLAVVITALAGVSGAHFNPAVTLGFLAIKRIDPKTAVSYIGAQMAGGVAGALASKLLIPNNVGRLLSNGLPQVNTNLQFGGAVALEALLTFFLMSAIMGTLVNPKAPKLGGLWVGLVLIAMILVGGPITGAALNPARALGPAVASGVWTAQLVYWLGPIIGAVAAAFVWEKVLLKDDA